MSVEVQQSKECVFRDMILTDFNLVEKLFFLGRNGQNFNTIPVTNFLTMN